MECYLVTESEGDRALISRLLDAEIADGRLRIVAGGERSGSLSLARSYLVARRKPVALLLDADTTDPVRQEEQKDFLDYAMRAASPGVAWRVFLAVPELESSLFDFSNEADRALLQEIAGTPFTAEEAVRGEFVPKEVLNSLFQRGLPQSMYSGEALAQLLDDNQVSHLRESPLMKDILAFVDEASRQPA